MNTVSRVKMLVLSMTAGLLFVATASNAAQFSYVPSNLKVALTPSQGQKQSQVFQQEGKLEAEGLNTNTMNVSNASTGAYGLTTAETMDSSQTTVTSCVSCGEPEQVVSVVSANTTLSGLLSLSNVTDILDVEAATGGVGPYVVEDTLFVSLQSTGASVPSGNYAAGTKFTVNAPVSINVGSTTETDNFVGKMVFGELKPIKNENGKVTGTRLAEIHLTGSVTDSAGNVYTIDQIIGENDLDGVKPNQVTLNYTLNQG